MVVHRARQEPSSMSDEKFPKAGFGKFLQETPPQQIRELEFYSTPKVEQTNNPGILVNLSYPTIELHCRGWMCDGPRIFRYESDNDYGREYLLVHDKWQYAFIRYVCGNCQDEMKIYAIALRAESQPYVRVIAYKFGEFPKYGPETPPRLISLIGPDKDLFLKGRQSESQGLGIGALTYYRRVVEQHKDRIIDEIIKVAKRIGKNENFIAILVDAKKNPRFSDAVDQITDAIPASLFIDGHNPLTLLHRALSKGVHGKTDEECLEIAQDIRVVLVRFADLVGQALKEQRELSDAVARLGRS
jgi:hypothetical protein